jgi:hypothetical protein
MTLKEQSVLANPTSCVGCRHRLGALAAPSLSVSHPLIHRQLVIASNDDDLLERLALASQEGAKRVNLSRSAAVREVSAMNQNIALWEGCN